MIGLVILGLLAGTACAGLLGPSSYGKLCINKVSILTAGSANASTWTVVSNDAVGLTIRPRSQITSFYTTADVFGNYGVNYPYTMNTSEVYTAPEDCVYRVGKTLYFYSDTVPATVEIMYWTK